MLTNYSVHISVCVCLREKESGLCPLGLSVSLIKDRRLMERKCVACLACRPQQQHIILVVWRECANGKSGCGCGGGGGLLRKRKLDEWWRKIHIYHLCIQI